MVDENPYAFTMPDQQDAFSGSVEFKLSFTTSITFVLGWAIPSFVLIILIIEGVNTRSVPGVLIASVGAALFGLGGTAIFVAYYKVYVRNDRLRGFNAMGGTLNYLGQILRRFDRSTLAASGTFG